MLNNPLSLQSTWRPHARSHMHMQFLWCATPVTTLTVAPTVFQTTVPIAMARIAIVTVLKTLQLRNRVCYPQRKLYRKTQDIPQVRHIDKVVGVPVVEQRQAPTIQTEQKTIDVPQIQCLEPLVDVPVVTQLTTEIPVVMLKQVPTLPQVQYNEKEVEVPVMVRRQIPLVQRIQKMVEVPQIQYIDNCSGNGACGVHTCDRVHRVGDRSD